MNAIKNPCEFCLHEHNRPITHEPEWVCPYCGLSHFAVEQAATLQATRIMQSLAGEQLFPNPPSLSDSWGLTVPDAAVACHFCGERIEAERACEAGWIPSFYPDASEAANELFEPVCPECASEHLTLGEGFWFVNE